MVYNTAICDDTSERDKELLSQVMWLAIRVKDYIKSLNYSKHLVFECHSICRAISMTLPELKLVDGNYLGLEHIQTEGKLSFELCFTSHSWLVTPDNSIIDPYPVGYLAVNPVLVVNKGKYSPFGGKLYIPDQRITSEISDGKMWRKSKTLYELIKKARKASKA